MNTRCPCCGKIFEVDEACKGKEMDCRYCEQPFIVQGVKTAVPLNFFSSTPNGKLGPAPGIKDDFKTPILAMIYDTFAILCLMAAVFFLILGLINHTDLPFLIAFACSIGAAAVSFGIAQIITSIVKTAHNTDKIVELLSNRIR